MFRNTLTANDKYPFRDGENLSTPNQMQLSLKQKTFAHFLNKFLESRSHFTSFQKKMIVIALLLLKLQTVNDLGRLLFKKHRFRTPIDSQHV